MAVTGPERRLVAWHRAFDLAVEVFRLTSAVDDRRTNGLASRLRGTALRVPALVTRAAGRRQRRQVHGDLEAALRALASLEAHLRLGAVLLALEPSEARAIRDHLAESRRAIGALAGRVAVSGDGAPALPVEGSPPEV